MVNFLGLFLAIIFAVLAIIATLLLIRFVKGILVNTALGVAFLFLINFLGESQGVHLSLNFANLLVAAGLGLSGVGLLLVLYFLGIKF